MKISPSVTQNNSNFTLSSKKLSLKISYYVCLHGKRKDKKIKNSLGHTTKSKTFATLTLLTFEQYRGIAIK